jgi:Uma2 family endonuclease
MIATDAQTRCTRDEYLARERANEHRSEYIDGWMRPMPRNDQRHNLIVGSLITGVGRAPRDRPCRCFAVNMRVKVPATGFYTYPDLVAVCGEAVFEDEHLDTLLNPGVAVEVLSDQTERYDRGVKSAHYRRLDSLHEYVLVSQTLPLVEQYIRAGDVWKYRPIEELDGSLTIETLGCTLPLADIYEGVEFPAAGERERR